MMLQPEAALMIPGDLQVPTAARHGGRLPPGHQMQDQRQSGGGSAQSQSGLRKPLTRSVPPGRTSASRSARPKGKSVRTA